MPGNAAKVVVTERQGHLLIYLTVTDSGVGMVATSAELSALFLEVLS